MCKQHHEVTQGMPRTNNSVEAWHRSYNATVGYQHPNIWRFIDALKREQGLVEVKQAKFLAGEKPTTRQKDKANEEGLKSLILRLRAYLVLPQVTTSERVNSNEKEELGWSKNYS